jgi:hypothetical protein
MVGQPAHQFSDRTAGTDVAGQLARMASSIASCAEASRDELVIRLTDRTPNELFALRRPGTRSPDPT